MTSSINDKSAKTHSKGFLISPVPFTRKTYFTEYTISDMA